MGRENQLFYSVGLKCVASRPAARRRRIQVLWALAERGRIQGLRRSLFLAAILAVALAMPAAALGAETVVSINFDDGWDSQSIGASELTAKGMSGTFYVNSPRIDQPGFLTWAQLTAFNAAGHEVGGHTLTHSDLTTLTATQAQREICDDRTNILSQGFVVSDFAYPYGAYDSNTGAGTLDASSIVSTCGYASGRGAFGLHNITATNDTRPYRTTIPPPNRYKILTPCCIDYASFGSSTPTAVALENYVQHAESSGGGWVIFVFHRLCDNCGGDSGGPSMSPTEFKAFLDWLQPRAASGTVVKTVAQVIKNDSQGPTSSISCNGVACSNSAYPSPVSVSLSATDTGAAGVASIHYTTDGSDPTVASPTYTGPFTVSTTTTVKYRAWDNANNVEATKSSLIQIDSQGPTSSISCDGAACSSSWFGAPVSVSLSATDTDSGVAAIRYTTDGSDPTVASPTYTSPFTVSSTTTVKYRAWDNAGNVEATNSQLIQIDTTAPTSSISCNGTTCSNSTYSAAVTVTLSATDDQSGVAVIRYTLDGSDPTASSTAYSDPISVSETTTVKYRAWDNAGNVEATKSQVVQVVQTVPDTDPPTSSIACNFSPCSNGWYGGAVSVSLAAADGGSGVAAIRYTTDGSDPTAASPTYTAPFTVSATTTVKYRSWDNAGNVEATNSQLIRIDTTAPSSSITCNGGACSTGWYKASVSVSLSATDSQSGVAAIRYTTDGSTPTTSSPAYVGSFVLSATTTVKYRAWDNAGNAEATKSRLIRIDFVAPTVAITSPSGGATVTGNVKITAAASDGGSGIAQVSFYADGVLIGTARSAPYSVSWNTKKVTKGQHTLVAVAQDAAGNSQASASIQVTVR
jgi:peptidoglycan/xylan/chitin deacetylase (PgdA/CDA1 family)